MQINAEAKIIGAVFFATFIILIGGVFFLSKDEKPVSKGEVVAQNGIHWHPRLSVYIKGQKQEFTDSIGLGAVHQPMHTHSEDYKQGIVHMEFGGTVTKDETKLSNFFKIWGKQFNSSCVFDNCGEGKVKMLVNGVENKNFENYAMRDGDNIEVRFE